MTKQISDAVAAVAFHRLVAHLQHRHDAQNIDLMGYVRILPQLPRRLGNGGDQRGWRRDVQRRSARIDPRYADGSVESRISNRSDTPAQLEKMKESLAKNKPAG